MQAVRYLRRGQIGVGNERQRFFVLVRVRAKKNSPLLKSCLLTVKYSCPRHDTKMPFEVCDRYQQNTEMHANCKKPMVQLSRHD